MSAVAVRSAHVAADASAVLRKRVPGRRCRPGGSELPMASRFPPVQAMNSASSRVPTPGMPVIAAVCACWRNRASISTSVRVNPLVQNQHRGGQGANHGRRDHLCADDCEDSERACGSPAKGSSPANDWDAVGGSSSGRCPGAARLPAPQPSPRTRPPSLPGLSRPRRRPLLPQAPRPPHHVGHGPEAQALSPVTPDELAERTGRSMLGVTD
jgi:hypothetical protein